MSEIDEQEAFESIRQLAQRTAVAVAALIAIIIFVAIRFARSLTKPIQLLTRTANELAQGNLEVQID